MSHRGKPCSYRRPCRRHPFPRSNLHAGGPRTPPVFLDRLHGDLSAEMGDGGMDADSCKACHDDSSLITGKQTAWAMSGHGAGTAFDYALSLIHISEPTRPY